MLKKEMNYEFRRRIDTVHAPDIADAGAVLEQGEIAVTAAWHISYPADASEAVFETARDLQDFFRDSLNINLTLCKGGNDGIVLCPGDASLGKNEYIIDVTDDKIAIIASGNSGIRRGGVRLEDIFKLRGAAFIKKGSEKYSKLITPRIVHSGWGIELFPDSHLNAIMHAGFDAIAVFCTGPNRTNIGTLDFNDLIARAAKYDVAVYL